MRLSVEDLSHPTSSAKLCFHFIQHMGHDYISHVVRYAENLILQYAIIRLNITAIKSCTFSLVLPETTKWAKQWENHVNSRDPKRVFHSSS